MRMQRCKYSTWIDTLFIKHVYESSAFTSLSCSCFYCLKRIRDLANMFEQEPSRFSIRTVQFWSFVSVFNKILRVRNSPLILSRVFDNWFDSVVFDNWFDSVEPRVTVTLLPLAHRHRRPSSIVRRHGPIQGTPTVSSRAPPPLGSGTSRLVLLVLGFCFGSDRRVLLCCALQYRPSSSFNGPQWSTNSGAPVWNNDNSLTVGSRGIISDPLCLWRRNSAVVTLVSKRWRLFMVIA
jgi:hypothetical protein